MTSAPFRDLFVELPRAVFESLHAWGEAVIVKAQTPPPRPSLRIPTVVDRLYLVCERYGWTEARSQRVAECCQMEIWARRSCCHWQRYLVDDLALRLAGHEAAEQLAVLDSIVDRTPRNCYCVQSEP